MEIITWTRTIIRSQAKTNRQRKKIDRAYAILGYQESHIMKAVYISNIQVTYVFEEDDYTFGVHMYPRESSNLCKLY